LDQPPYLGGIMLIFVYGTLKRGERNHDVLDDSEFVSEATTEALYLLYDRGAYPCMVKAECGKNIKGEVYRVSDETLKRLDSLEGVGYGLYERARIRLLDVSVPCWGYLYLRGTRGMNECGPMWTGKD